MAVLQSLYPSAERFSSILVFGSSPNSSEQYYILSRLSPEARVKVVHHDPFAQSPLATDLKVDNALVIINRYITRGMVVWLKRHHARLSGLVWVLDDDLRAMTYSNSVPARNKVKPALTLFNQRSLLPMVDHMLVSTNRLKAIYADWPVRVTPPVTEAPVQTRPLDIRHMYYFAKMHGPEHEFLRPVMQRILGLHKDASFSVIATGKTARRWKRIERVKVIPEMGVEAYENFLAALPSGGLFLVPLVRNRINASRSDAKIIEIVKSGSAGLIANARAYRRVLNDDSIRTAGISGVASDEDSWVDAIDKLLSSPNHAERNRSALRNFARQRFEKRLLIV